MPKLDPRKEELVRAFVDSDEPPPPRPPIPTLSDARPWYRKAWDWVFDIQKGVVAVVAIVAAGTAVNVWIHGLITTQQLDAAVQTSVEAAMVKALATERGRITTLETNMAGVPEFRGATITTLAQHEGRIVAVEKTSDRSTQRIDSMMGRR